VELVRPVPPEVVAPRAPLARRPVEVRPPVVRLLVVRRRPRVLLGSPWLLVQVR